MKKDQLYEIIEQVYFEVLQEAVLASSTQQILGKFPTLNKTLVQLLTREFNAFIDEVLWVSPKPTTFKIVLKNGQSFFLKWLDKGFQAQIGGKKYYLTLVDEYQQALDAIGEILKYAPPSETETIGTSSPQGFENDIPPPDTEGFGEEPEPFEEEEPEFD